MRSSLLFAVLISLSTFASPIAVVGQSAPDFEFFANLTDENDTRITDENSRSAQTDVGEIHYLEISYSDLRSFIGEGLFAFSIDVEVNPPTAIEVLLVEEQRLDISLDLINATDGFLELSVEGSSEAIEIPFSELSVNYDDAIRRAVATLQQVDPSVVRVQTIEPVQGVGDFISFIRYKDLDLAGRDLPDLRAITRFDIPVRVSASSQSVTEPDGSPNYALVTNLLDFRSRSILGQPEVYSFLQFGDFDPEFGFRDVGGVGPIIPNGISATFDFRPISDLDSVAIPFRVKSAERIEFTLSAGSREILAYGVDVPVDDLLLFGEQRTVTLDASPPPPPPLPWWVRLIRYLLRLLRQWFRFRFG
ncbi:MAG: hypothetical protein AAFV88_19145 [Planctomycetota bacterium]